MGGTISFQFSSFDGIRLSACAVILQLSVFCAAHAGGLGSSPHFIHVSTEQGLSQSSVYAIYQDWTGSVWFATMSGVDRYDGYSVKRLHGPDLRNGHGPVGPAYAICEWNGRLWVGWDAEGVAWYDKADGAFHRPELRQSRNTVSTLFPENDTLLWIGTGSGLYTLSGQIGSLRYDSLGGAAGEMLGDRFVSAVCRDAQRRLWIATTNGLFCRRPGEDSLRAIGRSGPRESRLSSQTVRALYHDSNGRVWICSDGGLDCYSDTRGIEHVLGGQVLTSIICARSGDLWLGTWDAGVIVFDPTRRVVRHQLRPLTGHAGGLPSGRILSLTTDDFNGIWVGTADAGAHRASEGGFSHAFYQLPAVATGRNCAWAVFVPPSASEKHVYIGAQSGLFEFRGDQHARCVWTSRHPLRAICEARPEEGGGLWVATLGGGLKHLQQAGGRFRESAEFFARPPENKDGSIYALHRDHAATLWIGSNGSGIQSFSGTTGEKKDHPLVDGVDTASWAIAIEGDGAGALWVGTWKQGVWRRAGSDSRFTKLQFRNPSMRPLEYASIFSLASDRRHPGVLWIGTNGDGLWRYDMHTGEGMRYAESHGLPDNTVYGIVQDTEGLLWISTNCGIVAIDPANGNVYHPSEQGGEVRGEFSLGAACMGREGSVLFGGAGGFVECAHSAGVRCVPPSLVLSGVAVGGKDLQVLPATDGGAAIRVEPDSWPLSLVFTAIHMDAPGQNLYSFSIPGIDTHWTTATTNRRLDIPFLPPGEYAVRVRASTPGGVWSPAPLRIAVVAVPAFRETWGFKALIAGGVFTLLALVGGAWIHRKRVLHQERARLRKKIATDFHDDFGARAARISMTAHLLRDEKSTAGDSMALQLEHLARDAQKLSSEMRGMTWELDPEKDSLMDLAVYLKGYSDELYDDTPIAFSLEGVTREFENIILPMEWRQQIGRIFKEAMTNTIKHAEGCRHVLLSFTVERGGLVIALRDDGCGFDPAGARTGNGLRNMIGRAQSLHGELTIDSIPGTGTQIRFHGTYP